MTARDQKMRRSNRWKVSVDRTNTAELKKIVKHFGWPDKRLVGTKGSEAAWLIAQHADHDIRFQQRCLELMTNPAMMDHISPIQIAYLTDRVRVHKKKKQQFGTQFYVTRQGRFMPRPIKNKKTLNRRRNEIGLESFEKYKAELLMAHARLRKK